MVIQYIYTLQNDHHSKSSYHLLIQNCCDFISYIPHVHFIHLAGSLHFLVSLIYLINPDIHLPSGKHLFILCISEFFSALLCFLIYFLGSTFN